MTNATRVVMVDDHPLVRQSIQTQLARHPDIELVGEGEDGVAVFELVDRLQPDILLLDVNMPQSKGRRRPAFLLLPTLAKLNRQYPETKIIVLTQADDHALIAGAMEHGVGGYILKSDDLSLNLPEAIRAVARSGVYFSESIGPLLPRLNGSAHKVGLTPRQMEVLRTIARFPNDTSVVQAAHMQIAETTFKSHLQHVFSVLGVKSRAAAIIRGIQLGLLPIEIVFESRSEVGWNEADSR